MYCCITSHTEQINGAPPFAPQFASTDPPKSFHHRNLTLTDPVSRSLTGVAGVIYSGLHIETSLRMLASASRTTVTGGGVLLVPARCDPLLAPAPALPAAPLMVTSPPDPTLNSPCKRQENGACNSRSLSMGVVTDFLLLQTADFHSKK